MTGPTSVGPSFGSVRPPNLFAERVAPVDFAVLLAVPLVLCGVFMLPVPLRQSLAFDYSDPSMLAAFAAPYVHLDWTHLLVNVVGYLLVAPTAYLLSVASDQRARFFAAFVTFLVAFPPVLSYLNLAVPRSASALGFSGVVLAFVGYLALAIADHLSTNLRLGPTASIGPVLFFLGFALAAPLSVQSVTVDRATVALGTGGLVLATLLSAALFALSTVEAAGSPRRRARAATLRRGPFGLAVMSTGVFVAFQFVAFPPRPELGTATVNLYTHLLGYALGFMVTYVSILVIEHADHSHTGI